MPWWFRHRRLTLPIRRQHLTASVRLLVHRARHCSQVESLTSSQWFSQKVVLMVSRRQQLWRQHRRTEQHNRQRLRRPLRPAAGAVCRSPEAATGREHWRALGMVPASAVFSLPLRVAPGSCCPAAAEAKRVLLGRHSSTSCSWTSSASRAVQHCLGVAAAAGAAASAARSALGFRSGTAWRQRRRRCRF